MEVRHCVRCPSLASDALRDLQASHRSGASSGRLQQSLFRSLPFSSCSSVGVNAGSLTSSHSSPRRRTSVACCPCISGRCIAARPDRMNVVQDLSARCNSDRARCASQVAQEALEATSYAIIYAQHPHAKPRLERGGVRVSAHSELFMCALGISSGSHHPDERY